MNSTNDDVAKKVELAIIPSRIYDPLLVQVPKALVGYQYEAGFIIRPSGSEQDLTLITLGNSSSLWPAHDWALIAADTLHRTHDRPVTVMNGAGRAHTSAQELLRVIRDVPVIRPDVVLAMSGICDLGFIVSSPGYPFYHKYSDIVREALVATEVAGKVLKGSLDARRASQIWLDNHRMAALICADLGVHYIAGLQPVLGVGIYKPNEQEHDWLYSKGNVILRGTGRPYLDEVLEFYAEVKAELARDPSRHAHVVDFTGVFDHESGIYLDHRHQTPKGNAILGNAVAEVLASRLAL